MTLHISLSKALEDHISKQVASGRYNSASEMISEALLHFEHIQQIQSPNLIRLRKEIDKGMKDIHSGKVKMMDIAAIKLRARLSVG